MSYITGFIDVRKHVFYENQIPSHDKNARNIIDLRNWTEEFYNDPDPNISPSDFLVFRKDFAQIGCSGQRKILVSDNLYKNDTNNSKIWKAIFKTLNSAKFEDIASYKLFKIKR